MTKATPRLRLEMLENRWNPAGTVTGSFSRGTWTLTGDTAGNSITINPTATPGQFILSGIATSISGETNPSNVRNIVVNMLAGGDAITLNDTGIAAALTGSLTVNGGTEDNYLAINNMTIGANVSVTNGTNSLGQDQLYIKDSDVLGKVTVSNGDGDTFTDLRRTSAGSSFIGKGATITNGKGTDSNFLVDYEFGGNVNVKNGLPGLGDIAGRTVIGNSFNTSSMAVITGNLSVSYTSGYINSDFLAATEIGGNVIFDHGTGAAETVFDSSVSILPVVIRGSLSIIDKGPSSMFLGDGTGNSSPFTFLRNGLTVGKNLNLTVGNGGSTLNLDRVTVGGKTKIVTGSGIDTINIDDSVFHGFQLLTGLGADIVNIEQQTSTQSTTQFLGKTKVDLGGGVDNFSLGDAADFTRQVEFFGPAKLSGGKDTDFDNIYRSNLVTAFNTPTYDFDNVI